MVEGSMKTDPISFRPRNGLCAEAFYRIRLWCEDNGFSFSDVINAVLPALSYYLHNHCSIDQDKSQATVDLNIGPIEILHVVNGKCYPLTSETNTTKNYLSKPELQERIKFWYEKNRQQLDHTDLILLEEHHASRRNNKANTI